MRIAICDDSTQDTETMQNVLYRVGVEFFVEYEIYNRPKELLKDVREGKNFDLYVFDVEMPDLNGIELAEQIRETDAKALFVFLTSHAKYMGEVFEVMTFNYIIKPITDARLRSVIRKAISYLSLSNQSFSFLSQRVKHCVKYEDILYFEKQGRQAVVYTVRQKYITNMTLGEIWEQLDERAFATIHGSYVVNLKHISMVASGKLTLEDGTELPVTRSYRREFAEKHFAFARGGM